LKQEKNPVSAQNRGEMKWDFAGIQGRRTAGESCLKERLLLSGELRGNGF